MTSETFADFRNTGYALAGEPGHLRRRASIYHQMYRDSGKRNVFPLIAAHGSLWASGFFRKGELGARVLSLPYLLVPGARQAKLRTAALFADHFRDINRRICGEAYAIYHYTRVHGGDRFIRSVIGDAFADILCECHDSIQSGTDFPQEKREKLFSAFLHWEQVTIVAPSLAAAFADLQWGAIAWLALKTKVDMAYLGWRHALRFENFASKEERIERGMQAYRRAEQVGLAHVEATLQRYRLVPDQVGHAAAPALEPGRLR